MNLEVNFISSLSTFQNLSSSSYLILILTSKKHYWYRSLNVKFKFNEQLPSTQEINKL